VSEAFQKLLAYALLWPLRAVADRSNDTSQVAYDRVGVYVADYSLPSDDERAASDAECDALFKNSRVVSEERETW
jgi:hypothetical protein